MVEFSSLRRRSAPCPACPNSWGSAQEQRLCFGAHASASPMAFPECSCSRGPRDELSQSRRQELLTVVTGEAENTSELETRRDSGGCARSGRRSRGRATSFVARGAPPGRRPRSIRTRPTTSTAPLGGFKGWLQRVRCRRLGPAVGLAFMVVFPSLPRTLTRDDIR